MPFRNVKQPKLTIFTDVDPRRHRRALRLRARRGADAGEPRRAPYLPHVSLIALSYKLETALHKILGIKPKYFRPVRQVPPTGCFRRFANPVPAAVWLLRRRIPSCLLM